MSEIIEPEELDEETSEPSISEIGERDAALAAVLREQSEKAEVEAHTREVRIRRQGIGARHLTLLVATVLSIWFWISPPVYSTGSSRCTAVAGGGRGASETRDVFSDAKNRTMPPRHRARAH